MRKVIKYNNITTADLIGIISALRKINLSDSESATLSKLITYSENNSVVLDIHLGRQIREELKITQSSFNTNINRLEQKKCFSKTGKSIILNPIYNQITNCKEIVIKLE